MSYSGQAFYGLTVTEDYLGYQYLGCVFNVIELSYSYKGKAPIRNSFSVSELVEEFKWTEFFLHKLGVVGQVELHNTQHDGQMDLPVKGKEA